MKNSTYYNFDASSTFFKSIDNDFREPDSIPDEQ